MRTRKQHDCVAGRHDPAGNTVFTDSASREGRASGFGIGAIRLDLQKTIYAAGESVEGTLLLMILRPVSARGLFAILSAQQHFYRIDGTSGKDGLHMVLRKVYHYQQELDGRKEYGKTEEPAAYPFRLVLPPNAGTSQAIRCSSGESGAATGIDGGAGAFVPFGPPEWSVEGYLDLPLPLDVKTKVSIGVQRV